MNLALDMHLDVMPGDIKVLFSNKFILNQIFASYARLR